MSVMWNTCSSDDAFAEEAAHFCLKLIQAAIQENGRCIIGLSGGTTPKSVYARLEQKNDIDWNAVHIFLIDERYIASDSADSNAHLIRSTLLQNASIPEANIHLPDISLPIDECIAEYEKQLTTLLSHPIDIAILGMGNDGHIASLFPPLSENAFGPSSVIHTVTDTFAVHDRISVTLPVLQSAKHALFLLKGDDKKLTWDEMTESSDDERRWPAKGLLGKNVTVFHQLP